MDESRYSALFIAYQEINRKYLTWRSMPTAFHIKLPPIVEYFLSFPEIYLAGGAVVSAAADRSIKDYDMFFVGHIEAVNQIVEKIRSEHECHESRFCITIYVECHKIQFIKRVYESPDHIIGGFDLDICRFYYKQGVWGLPTSVFTYDTGKAVINPYCQSKTFGIRINKYANFIVTENYYPYDRESKFRGIRKIRTNRYSYDLGVRFWCRDKREADLRTNSRYLLEKKYDKLYIRGTRYNLEDFVEHVSGKLWAKYTKLTLHISFSEFQSAHLGMLTRRFHHYENLQNLLIQNVTTQFTGSFYPTYVDPYKFAYQPSEFLPRKHLRDLVTILISLRRLPKPLRYKIAGEFLHEAIMMLEF